MKKFIYLCFFITIGYSSFSQGFFKRIPKPDPGVVAVEMGEWRPIATIPALKLVESTRSNTKIDALLLASAGGGISWQRLRYDFTSQKYKSIFSFSPATILLSGNLTGENPIDISYAMTIGVLNNLLMVGGGYDLGEVSGRSRFFGLISIGINFNN